MNPKSPPKSQIQHFPSLSLKTPITAVSQKMPAVGLCPAQYLGLSFTTLSTPNSLSNYFALDHLFFDLSLKTRIKHTLEGALSVDSDKTTGRMQKLIRKVSLNFAWKMSETRTWSQGDQNCDLCFTSGLLGDMKRVQFFVIHKDWGKDIYLSGSEQWGWDPRWR